MCWPKTVVLHATPSPSPCIICMYIYFLYAACGTRTYILARTYDNEIWICQKSIHVRRRRRRWQQRRRRRRRQRPHVHLRHNILCILYFFVSVRQHHPLRTIISSCTYRYASKNNRLNKIATARRVYFGKFIPSPPPLARTIALYIIRVRSFHDTVSAAHTWQPEKGYVGKSYVGIRR